MILADVYNGNVREFITKRERIKKGNKFQYTELPSKTDFQVIPFYVRGKGSFDLKSISAFAWTDFSVFPAAGSNLNCESINNSIYEF